MQSKTIFIGLAAGVLVLVVAAASFAGGAYFGQNGYVADVQYQTSQREGQRGPQDGRPQFGGPQQGGPRGGQNGSQAGQPAQGGFGAGGPPGAPSWPPDSIGHITAITDTQFTYQNRDGVVFTIAFDANTKFIDAEGVEITLADLNLGDVIAVYGADTATTIMQMPPKSPAQPAPPASPTPTTAP